MTYRVNQDTKKNVVKDEIEVIFCLYFIQKK